MTALQSLFGKQSCVNPAIYSPCAALASHPAYLISAESVAGMHTDADDISRHDGFRHNLLQRLIDENGISRSLRCSRCKNKQPSWRNDGRTKRIVAGIY